MGKKQKIIKNTLVHKFIHSFIQQIFEYLLSARHVLSSRGTAIKKSMCFPQPENLHSDGKTEINREIQVVKNAMEKNI